MCSRVIELMQLRVLELKHEADQLAIYKSEQGFELGTTGETDPASDWVEELNSEPSDYITNALGHSATLPTPSNSIIFFNVSLSKNCNLFLSLFLCSSLSVFWWFENHT